MRGNPSAKTLAPTNMQHPKIREQIELAKSIIKQREEFPITALYENPDKADEYLVADPYVIYSTYKYQGMKIRASIRVAKCNRRFKLTLKIDGKRKQPRLISVSRFLHCIEGSYIKENGRYYVSTETISTFLTEFARVYVVRTFNLPMQMELPIYQTPMNKPIQPETIEHPTLKILE